MAFVNAMHNLSGSADVHFALCRQHPSSDVKVVVGGILPAMLKSLSAASFQRC
jgi:hypothetical protein